MRRVGLRRGKQPQPFPGQRPHWAGLLRHVAGEVLSDHATMTAAGLAFYSLLGIIPILVAVSTLCGLLASPATVRHFIQELSGFVPGEAAAVLLRSLKNTGSGYALGFPLAISLTIVEWTAQWAASGLITALNIVFDTPERRGFLHRQIVALAVAVGGISFIIVALVVVVLLPAARSLFALELPYPLLLSVRWPLLAGLFMLCLSALYRLAPCRHRPEWKWLAWGAVLATALWVGVSGAFSAYAGSIASFNRLYGSLGGVAIFLFWLYLSGLIILLGAEFEAELEARQRGLKESAAKHLLKEREKNIPTG